jgi:hypothetical protein
MKFCSKFAAFFGLIWAVAVAAQTTVINCTAFNSSSTASCGIGSGWITSPGNPEVFWVGGGYGGTDPTLAGLSGSQVDLNPGGDVHTSLNLNANAPVNVQAFVANFTFIPNGNNVAFVLNNQTLVTSANAGDPWINGFTAGAGDEGSFYQECCARWPGYVWALQFNQMFPETNNGTFTYSNVQIYKNTESPINSPSNDNTWGYAFAINKISTSPVPMNSPEATALTTTGDLYSATILYTGNIVILNLYDITAGGSCPGSKCFTYTWNNVDIPSAVGGDTAWVGLASSVNVPVSASLYINSMSYTELPLAPSPTLSLSSGSYSGMQSVRLTDSAPVICWNTTGAPATDGSTGCTNGSLYTGSISISNGETVYAVAGGADYGDSSVASSTYTITGTGISPTFLPASGTYSGDQWVQLQSSSPTICWNTSGSPATDGGTGCTNGTLYTEPITVSSNETIYAVGGGAGLSDSAVDSATYILNPFAGTIPTASPTFSPVPGTYNGTQNVTISSTTPGSPTIICYELTSDAPALKPVANGLASGDTTCQSYLSQQPANRTGTCNPGCYTGTLYTGPVTVSSSQTLTAVAQATSMNTMAEGGGERPLSSPTIGIYTITTAAGPQATAPSCTPASGTSSTSIAVSCANSNSGTTIMCYTENGTTPATNDIGTGCTTGTALSGASGNITISATTATLNVVAGTSTLSDSEVSSYGPYTIGTVLPAPTFSPGAGTYTGAQTVTISDATAGATVYYTTNGTTPTTSSTKYTGPITVSSSETLEAIAVETGYTNSAAATATYTISLTAATPTFSVPAGTYTGAQTVTISDATAGATIYYTTNGTTPTTSSTKYTGPITVSSSETLEAIAAETGYSNSTVATVVYTINIPQLAAPAFTPNAGTYAGAQTVTISDATAGATVYYTTNGTMPTTSSTKYTGPITVSSSETLEAIATETGYTNSPVATAVYSINTFVPMPSFSVPGGTYTSAQTVTISDSTPGAMIYYTTDGTTPTTNSTHYGGPVTVSTSETINAIAVANGSIYSAVASATYTIDLSPPNFTLMASPISLTVKSGTTGTTTLTVTPQNGFSSAVSFACSGLPTGASCAFSPATVIPSGSAATTTLTFTAPAAGAAVRPAFIPGLPRSALTLAAFIFGLRRRRVLQRWVLLAIVAAGFGLLSGCGGGESNTRGGGSTPVTSTVTVSATSGSLTQTTTISLTVN